MTPQELKKARAELGLSQDALSKKLEHCRRFIVYRESGILRIPSWLEWAMKGLLSENNFKK